MGQLRSRAGAGGSAALWRYALTVLLGLPRRPARASATAAPRPGPAASSFEAPVEAVNELQFTRAYWLPPFGRGNGRDALFWAPLADVPEDRVDAVLRALDERGIPSWAARIRGRSDRPAQRGGPHALWVESGQLEDAQNVLMRVAPASG